MLNLIGQLHDCFLPCQFRMSAEVVLEFDNQLFAWICSSYGQQQGKCWCLTLLYGIIIFEWWLPVPQIIDQLYLFLPDILYLFILWCYSLCNYIYVTYFTLYIIWYCILLVSICRYVCIHILSILMSKSLKHIWEVPELGLQMSPKSYEQLRPNPPICGFVGALSPKCPSLAVLQCFALIDAYTPPTPDIISDAKKR